MGIRAFTPTLTGYFFQLAQFSTQFIIGSLLLALNVIFY